MLGSRHRLFVQCLYVSATELVKVEVALQGRWQKGGLLGVEGVLGDRAGGGGGGRGQVESVAVGVGVGGASVFLLKVEVTQADGEAGVVCLAPQSGGADCREGAWAQAVGRNNLAVWRGRETEMRSRRRLIVVLLCSGLIRNVSGACGNEASQMNCEPTTLRRAESAARLTTSNSLSAITLGEG